MSPIVVQPGHSATIPVIIAPTGTVGTHVSGVLYLDDDSLWYYAGRPGAGRQHGRGRSL